MTKAEESAKQVLLDYGVDKPPVPVEDIARSLGLSLCYEPFEGDVSGVLLRDDDSLTIGINSSHSPRRQRFTVGHEVGHFLLHPGRPLIVDKSVRVNLRDGRSSLATNREEIQANAFAAELLMPKEMIRGEFERGRWPANDLHEEAILDDLAEKFEVSRQAMEFRLVNLGLRSPG